MKVGDIVMWLGHDEEHGCLGVIMIIRNDGDEQFFTVFWHDGTIGNGLNKQALGLVSDADV
jgi:hypothetical protein